jgi:hypothetical protein
MYKRFLQIYPAALPGLSFALDEFSREREANVRAFAKFHIVIIVTGVGGG